MNLLLRRAARSGRGRHHADSLTTPPVLPERRGPVPLHGRHAVLHQPPRVSIVREFTGWAGLARLCAEAAAHPVVDLRTACPSQVPVDLDMTQPFFLELPPMNTSRVHTDAEVAMLLADITPTGGDAR